MSSPVVHIEKIEYHTHNHVDLADIHNHLHLILNKLNSMATDFTQLEQEVSENLTVSQSAIVLLKGLKTLLDAAGTDPVKLKALSDSLSSNTDALAAAVTENTPAEPPAEPPVS